MHYIKSVCSSDINWENTELHQLFHVGEIKDVPKFPHSGKHLDIYVTRRFLDRATAAGGETRRNKQITRSDQGVC